jgi:hypothetical protein
MRTSARWILLTTVFLAPLTAGAQEQAAPVGAPPPAPAPAPAPAEPVPAVPVGAPAAGLTAPAAAPAPTPPPVAFTWEALADMYYMYNFSGEHSRQAPGLRNFDQTSNNFALNYAKLGVGVDTEYVAFRLDLGAGHTAAIINSGIRLYSAGQFPGSPEVPNADGTTTPAKPASSLLGLGSSDFLIQQAFGTWKITKDISLDAGRFVTSASAEVIEASKNFLYSRSFLFYGVPLLHTGLRLNAAITPEIKLQLSLVNGWNNDVDNNIGKTGGVSLAYTPANSSNTSVIVTSYFGKESPDSAGPMKILFDGVFARDVGPVSLNVNLDYYKFGDPWWFGGSLMGRMFLTESFNLALRGEYIMSKKGAFDGGKEDAGIYEGTLMAGYVVAKHFEIRAEGRGDFSDKELFPKDSAADTWRKNQFTGTLALLTYF